MQAVIATLFLVLFSRPTLANTPTYRHRTPVGQKYSSWTMGAYYEFPFMLRTKDITSTNVKYDESPADLDTIFDTYQQFYDSHELATNYRRIGFGVTIGYKTTTSFRWQVDFGFSQGRREITEMLGSGITLPSGTEIFTLMYTMRTLSAMPKLFFEFDRLPFREKFIPYVGGGAGLTFTTGFFQTSLNEIGSGYITDRSYLSGISFAYQLVGGLRFRITGSVFITAEYRYGGTIGGGGINNILKQSIAVGLMYMSDSRAI